MNKTGIEYLDYTWNPLAMRCTRCSPACDHCWHLSFANRLSKNPQIPADVRAAYAGDVGPLLVEARLDEPCRVSKPARIGVQFMGDLFHEDVPFDVIRQVYAVMWVVSNHGHTFHVLTKRPRRALEYYEYYRERLAVEWGGRWNMEKELAHVHLGVTAENQEMADERIPVLLQIPAAIHFVSCEPLLGWIRIDPYFPRYDYRPTYAYYRAAYPGMANKPVKLQDGLNLVIAGAETGPGKRPMKLDWTRSLRDQCQDAGTPFFFKRDSDGNRMLDGRLWEQMPT